MLDRPYSDEMLQRIARENNLSETAYLRKTGESWHLRWSTLNGEIDLCGHATAERPPDGRQNAGRSVCNGLPRLCALPCPSDGCDGAGHRRAAQPDLAKAALFSVGEIFLPPDAK